MTTHDVIVIGGSLAGAAAAIELRKAGVDVAVFDRDRFPRQKVCGEFLSPGAVRTLAELGVGERLSSAGAVAIDRARIVVGSRRVEIPFEGHGLGVSRQVLEGVLADRSGVAEGHSVEEVRPNRGGFRLRVVDPDGRVIELGCRAVVDAAGKRSRFSRRRSSAQYGVQFHEAGDNGSILDFRFFAGGYGGTVSVEGGRRNSCFLVDRERLAAFRAQKEGCVVTGPIGYERVSGKYLSIGDAAGMIDPFCGEGMRHALDSGRIAGRAIAEGLARGRDYEEIRRSHEREWNARWRRRRDSASRLRRLVEHPTALGAAFVVASLFPSLPASFLRNLWK